jgi:hypothetical protein
MEGLRYLSSKLSVDDQIAIDTIQMSLDGDVKLGGLASHDPFLAKYFLSP